MSQRTRQMLIEALNGIAIVAYVWSFCLVVLCAASLIRRVYVEGLSFVEGVVAVGVDDVGSFWWMFLLIPTWVIARGLHGLLDVGCWTWRGWL